MNLVIIAGVASNALPWRLGCRISPADPYGVFANLNDERCVQSGRRDEIPNADRSPLWPTTADLFVRRVNKSAIVLGQWLLTFRTWFDLGTDHHSRLDHSEYL